MTLGADMLWILAGAAFLALEAFGITGVGFLFAGFAALCVAVLASVGLIGPESYPAQFAWFFALTVLWAVLLWKPVKRMTIGRKPRETYNSIVGEEAIVSEPGLTRGAEGQVRWSGTQMRAEIAADAPDNAIESGARVVIAVAEGNKFFVKRKA